MQREHGMRHEPGDRIVSPAPATRAVAIQPCRSFASCSTMPIAIMLASAAPTISTSKTQARSSSSRARNRSFFGVECIDHHEDEGQESDDPEIPGDREADRRRQVAGSSA